MNIFHSIRIYAGSAILLCSATTFAADNLQTDTTLKEVPGRIVMIGGEHLEFPAITLPEFNESGLLASGSTPYHDSLFLIDVNDILYMEVWHPSTPDSINRLYNVRLRHTERKVLHCWGQIDIRTPYGFTVMAYPRYRVKQDGALDCITLWGNKRFSRPRFYVLYYGNEYYESWPPSKDRRMIQYLTRDGSDSAGSSDAESMRDYDTGFDADDFFSIPDAEFGF